MRIQLIAAASAIAMTLALSNSEGDDPPEAAPAVAFTNVHVLTMSSPEILRHQTVVARGDVIEHIGPAESSPIPPGTLEIPGAGRFLVPGLADMHVHIDHPSSLGLYPAYGVTTVLNLRGLAQHLRWRAEIAAGERFGPTLYTTGDYMDGDPPDMPTLMSFATPEDAATSVGEQKKAGYDFLKVYAELSEQQLVAIGAAARREGIAMVGHSSDNYSLDTLLQAGQINLAHIEQFTRYVGDQPGGLRRAIAIIAQSGASVTPNLGLHRAMVHMWEDLDSLLARPEARYLHPAILQPFRRPSNRFVRRSEKSYKHMKEELIPHWRQVTRELHKAGVPLLVGTDSPVAGSYPGRAVWEELEALVTAGLSPYGALAAATFEPGRFIARHLDPRILFGQVREGFRADLLLLERNPLENISHVQNLAGVMMRGEWFPKPMLDDQLEARARSLAGLRESVLALEQHVYAGEIEQAREIFRGVRSVRPNEVLFSQYSFFFFGMSYLYGKEGFHPDPDRRRKALSLYEMYAETYAQFHSAHYMLGQALLANDQPEAAAASFARALEIHPYYPEARRSLTRIRRHLKSQ